MTIFNTRALCLLCALLCGCSALAEDELLSRNATYRVVGEGHISPWGDIVWVWPGTNTRPDEAGWMSNPLVEPTDTGDLLIDGRTDETSLVYTPGNWTGLGKRVNVEMTLPGQSRVSRVVVHLPAGPLYVTQTATLYVKGEDGFWKQVSEISPVDSKQRTLTFPLAPDVRPIWSIRWAARTTACLYVAHLLVAKLESP